MQDRLAMLKSHRGIRQRPAMPQPTGARSIIGAILAKARRLRKENGGKLSREDELALLKEIHASLAEESKVRQRSRRRRPDLTKR